MGGISILIQHPGTTHPNSPYALEELKANVYAPPGLIKELPSMQHVLAHMVQLFIEVMALLVTK